MKVEEFVKKMLVQQMNSYFAWVKMGVFLVLPSFVYEWGWWSVLLMFVLLGGLFFLLSKMEKKHGLDFMGHATRGVYLEYIGESEFITPIYKTILGETWKKIACILVVLIYIFFTLSLIEDDHLIIGSLLYYPCMLKIIRLLVEYADISKNSDYVIEDVFVEIKPHRVVHDEDEDDEYII